MRCSIIVLLDAASQQRMGKLVDSFEAAMIAAGLPVDQKRVKMEPFHTTLGVVNKYVLRCYRILILIRSIPLC